MRPQHFDILGSLAFAYITIFAINTLRGVVMPKWSVAVLVIVGIIGFIVDITIVFIYFIKKNDPK